MSVFEKVQEAIRPQVQSGHAQRNQENNISLKKANEEIKEMLKQSQKENL